MRHRTAIRNLAYYDTKEAVWWAINAKTTEAQESTIIELAGVELRQGSANILRSSFGETLYARIRQRIFDLWSPDQSADSSV